MLPPAAPSALLTLFSSFPVPSSITLFSSLLQDTSPTQTPGWKTWSQPLLLSLDVPIPGRELIVNDLTSQGCAETRTPGASRSRWSAQRTAATVSTPSCGTRIRWRSRSWARALPQPSVSSTASTTPALPHEESRYAVLKTMRVADHEKDIYQQWVELSVLRAVQHPNIADFYGSFSCSAADR